MGWRRTLVDKYWKKGGNKVRYVPNDVGTFLPALSPSQRPPDHSLFGVLRSSLERFARVPSGERASARKTNSTRIILLTVACHNGRNKVRTCTSGFRYSPTPLRLSCNHPIHTDPERPAPANPVQRPSTSVSHGRFVSLYWAHRAS